MDSFYDYQIKIKNEIDRLTDNCELARKLSANVSFLKSKSDHNLRLGSCNERFNHEIQYEPVFCKLVDLISTTGQKYSDSDKSSSQLKKVYFHFIKLRDTIRERTMDEKTYNYLSENNEQAIFNDVLESYS